MVWEMLEASSQGTAKNSEEEKERERHQSTKHSCDVTNQWMS